MTSICPHVFPCVVKCSMRFSSMMHEWLLLRVHLLWSGGGIVVLSTLSWLKIGSILEGLGLNSARASSAVEDTRQTIAGQKRRLFRIAFLTSVSLLMSLVISVFTGEVLKEWGRSSFLSLQCELYARSGEYNLDVYGFEDGTEVCSNASWTFFDEACTSACIFSNTSVIFSNGAGESNGTGELYCTFPNIKEVKVRNETFEYQSCACPCSDMVKVEKPSVLIMTLGYFSQSIVVVIVGINMGLRLQQLQTPFPLSKCTTISMQPLLCLLKFHMHIHRKDYRDQWRILLKRSSSTIVVVAPLPFDSQAYENESILPSAH
jgi:hypothetical protein